MTGKQKRKLRKRAHIAMAIHTQNAWIEDALFVQASTRRERDTLFEASRLILGKPRYVHTGVAS